ncbi:unnamed protein product [Amoebophrya sp. A120]|nr:unnamed protein product [Amoebophrya sp. A120]|eukprot:GSA120T00020085001.1
MDADGGNEFRRGRPPSTSQQHPRPTSPKPVLYTLLALLGASAWMPVQCVFSDAWKLIPLLPDGYQLPSNLSLAAQTGLVAVLIHTFLFRNVEHAQSLPVLSGTILTVVVGDVIALGLLASSWGYLYNGEEMISVGELQGSTSYGAVEQVVPQVPPVPPVENLQFFSTSTTPTTTSSTSLSYFNILFYLCYTLLACFACLTNLSYWPFVAHCLDPVDVPTGVVCLSGGATSSVGFIAVFVSLQRYFDWSPAVYFGLFAVLYAVVFLPVVVYLVHHCRRRVEAIVLAAERSVDVAGAAGAAVIRSEDDEVTCDQLNTGREPSRSSSLTESQEAMKNLYPQHGGETAQQPRSAASPLPLQPHRVEDHFETAELQQQETAMVDVPPPSRTSQNVLSLVSLFLAGAFQNGLFLSLTVFACRVVTKGDAGETNYLYFLITNVSGWLTPFAVAAAYWCYARRSVRILATLYWLLVGGFVLALAVRGGADGDESRETEASQRWSSFTSDDGRVIQPNDVFSTRFTTATRRRTEITVSRDRDEAEPMQHNIGRKDHQRDSTSDPLVATDQALQTPSSREEKVVVDPTVVWGRTPENYDSKHALFDEDSHSRSRHRQTYRGNDNDESFAATSTASTLENYNFLFLQDDHPHDFPRGLFVLFVISGITILPFGKTMTMATLGAASTCGDAKPALSQAGRVLQFGSSLGSLLFFLFARTLVSK